MKKTKEKEVGGGNSLPSFYAIIPAHIRYNENLSAQAKLFYAEITALCNKTGECWAGNDYFAKHYKLSKSWVSRIITELTNEGFIEVRYEFDDKKISKRIIKIVPFEINENHKGGLVENYKACRKLQGGLVEKDKGGIVEKDKDNITRNNNTSIIICDDDKNEKKDKSKDDKISSAIVFDEDLFKPTSDKLDLKEAENLFYKWQKFAGENNLIPIIKLTAIRLKNIKARLNESEFNFDEILLGIKSNDFWKTKYAGGQGVGFDDIIKSDNLYLKILEGKVRKNNFSNNGNTNNGSNGYSIKRIKCEYCNQSLVDGKHCYSRGCKNEMPIFLNDG